MRHFELTMLIEGEDDVTAEQLAHAFSVILKRAMRFSPDRRFNWGRAAVSTRDAPEAA